MASHRYNLEVTISDADRAVDYTLSLKVSAWPAVSASLSPSGYGWSPPEPAGMEIESCRCVEVTTWCGDYGISGRPAQEKDPEYVERKVGDWCLEKYADEIEEKAWDELNRVAEAKEE